MLRQGCRDYVTAGKSLLCYGRDVVTMLRQECHDYITAGMS